jgi:hypothetical protein
MSGNTLGTAMDALFLTAGGLGFARFGWTGLNRRRAAAAPLQAGSDAQAVPSPRPSTGGQIFSVLVLLFGGFIALCGLLLGLSLILPGSGS